MREQYQTRSAEVLIPDALFASGDLPAAAISLYCFLAYRQSRDGMTPSREEGMKALSIGRDTYAKYISSLTKAGLIRTVQTRQNGKFQSPAILLCESAINDFSVTDTVPEATMPNLPDMKKPDTVKPNSEDPNLVFSDPGYGSFFDQALYDNISQTPLQGNRSQSNILQDNIFNNNYNKSSSSSFFSSSSLEEISLQRKKKNDEIFQDLLRQYSANLSDPESDSEKEQSANYYLILLFRKIYRQLEQEGEELSLTRESLLYAIEKFKDVRQKRKIYSTDRYLKTFLPSVLLEYCISQTESTKKKGAKKTEKRAISNGEINRYYEQLQRKNRQLFESRRQALLEEIPQLAQVQKTIAETISQENRARLKQNTDEFLAAKQSLAQLERQEIQLLAAHGYGREALEPIEDCPYCHDTGMLDDGTFCHCRERVKQKLQEVSENSSLSA